MSAFLKKAVSFLNFQFKLRDFYKVSGSSVVSAGRILTYHVLSLHL